MPGYKLTPHNPNPITGIQNPLYGWHFIGSEALKVFSSFQDLVLSGWDYNLFKDPENPALQRMALSKSFGNKAPVKVSFEIRDAQWYAFDGGCMAILDEQDVNDNYTVEDWIGGA